MNMRLFKQHAIHVSLIRIVRTGFLHFFVCLAAVWSGIAVCMMQPSGPAIEGQALAPRAIEGQALTPRGEQNAPEIVRLYRLTHQDVSIQGAGLQSGQEYVEIQGLQSTHDSDHQDQDDTHTGASRKRGCDVWCAEKVPYTGCAACVTPFCAPYFIDVAWQAGPVLGKVSLGTSIAGWACCCFSCIYGMNMRCRLQEDEARRVFARAVASHNGMARSYRRISGDDSDGAPPAYSPPGQQVPGNPPPYPGDSGIITQGQPAVVGVASGVAMPGGGDLVPEATES